MSSSSKSELLRLVKPVIDRIAAACAGVPAGVATYGLLSMAVVSWRKTGLPLKALHDLVDELAKADAKDDN